MVKTFHSLIQSINQSINHSFIYSWVMGECGAGRTKRKIGKSCDAIGIDRLITSIRAVVARGGVIG
jgi:hypothetical protein